MLLHVASPAAALLPPPPPRCEDVAVVASVCLVFSLESLCAYTCK